MSTDKGLKIAFLMYLFPFNPHNWLNYIFGTTSLSFKHFFIANTGKLLDIVILVWLGT